MQNWLFSKQEMSIRPGLRSIYRLESCFYRIDREKSNQIGLSQMESILIGSEYNQCIASKQNIRSN